MIETGPTTGSTPAPRKCTIFRFHRWGSWSDAFPVLKPLVFGVTISHQSVQRRYCLDCGLIDERFLTSIQEDLEA